MKKYRFVDFAAHYQKGFRNHIVEIHEVMELVKKYQAYDCFSTYFFYTDEIFAYMSTHVQEGHPSISGYHGKVWAPFLPIDIDGKEAAKALEVVQLMGRTFVEEWKIPSEACHFYFSGSKGFHILLDIRLFGKVLPSQHLHQIFSTLREDLIYLLPDFGRSLVDLTIKDSVRLLRLPNTIHAKSGLYKIPLDFDEILSNSISDIQEKAKKARSLPFTDETGLVSNVSVEAHPKMAQVFTRVRRQVRRYTRRPFIYHFVPKHGENPSDFLCPGLLRIWESHIDAGHRNNCAIRLLSEFRLNGLGEDKSRGLIYMWNEKHQIGLSQIELEHTLHSAYAHPFPYRYSCHDPILQIFCPYQDVRRCDAWRQQKQVLK
jgi:hypothetical protein